MFLPWVIAASELAMHFTLVLYIASFYNTLLWLEL